MPDESKKEGSADPQVDILEDQLCPMCHKNTLTLRDMERDIPYFGPCYIFSMECSSCNYHMADVELDDTGSNAKKFTLEIESESDLNIRIVKSSQATVKVPRIMDISPGPVSNGYVTNVEGILNRLIKVLESQQDDEDPAVRTKVKNQLKKLHKVLWGREKLTLVIDDPSGNSAILSDKAVKG